LFSLVLYVGDVHNFTVDSISIVPQADMTERFVSHHWPDCFQTLLWSFLSSQLGQTLRLL